MCLQNVESVVVMACMLIQYVGGTESITVMVNVGKMVNRSVNTVDLSFLLSNILLKHAQYNTVLTLSLPILYTTKRHAAKLESFILNS